MKEIIRTLINNVTGKYVADEEELIDSGVLNSFSIVELLTEIESSFEIDVDLTDLVPANLASVKAIEVFIRSKRKGLSVKRLSLKGLSVA